jgi:hypothetical protein
MKKRDVLTTTRCGHYIISLIVGGVITAEVDLCRVSIR